MNPRVLVKYWRTVLTVAEMTFRQQMTDGFIFTVLFQSIFIAVLGLWMLKEKGPDAAMFVVVGIGVIYGVVGYLLFAAIEVIAKRRGTLEVF